MASRYKNYKCEVHDKFYEVNIYQKDPVNKHHWRATLARPARDIDLANDLNVPSRTWNCIGSFDFRSRNNLALAKELRRIRSPNTDRSRWKNELLGV
ncbi:hypothetical protein VCV18_011199 [Metarhizium anisopliae]